MTKRPARTLSPVPRTQSPARTTLPAHARPGAPAPARRRVPLHNRVRVLLVHIPRYSVQGQARLAKDVGVSRSTISRLVNGHSSPSYALAQDVTEALSRRLGRPLDPREVFSATGAYPTRSCCALANCPGCLPEEAYDADGSRRPAWRDARPGDWSLAPEAPLETVTEQENAPEDVRR